MKYYLRLFFAIAFTLITIGTIFPAPAAAQTNAQFSQEEVKSATLTWKTRFQISAQIGNTTILFNGDNPWAKDYKVQKDYPCQNSKVTTKSTTDSVDLKLEIFPSGAATTQCQSTGTITRPIDNKNYDLIYAFNGPQTIQRIDNDKGWIFQQYPSLNNIFLRTKENSDSCQDRIKYNSSNNTYKLYELSSKKNSNPAPNDIGLPQQCFVVNTTGATDSGTHSGRDYPIGAPDAPNPFIDSATPTTDVNLQCHSSVPVIGWFICEIIKSLGDAATGLDKSINDHLQINVNDFFGNNPNRGSTEATNANYQLWSTIRYIALSLLVIIALVMVIAQAVGSDLVDAYVIKKVLPRIAMAVVLIALSWQLGRFFVQLSNDFASGIIQLITAVAPPNVDLSFGGTSAGITSLGLIAGGVGLSTLSFMAVLSILAAALLAIFIGFLLVVFRELIIVLCVVAAPIAFVALILPNTQKVWKIWKDSFQGALIIFPLIVGLIYSGKLLAGIESEQAKLHPDDFTRQVAVMALYFGPYFLIPVMLKAVSGVLSTIGALVNDRGRGAFDRLKNFRRQEMGKKFELMKTGDRFQGKNIAARAYNRATFGAATGWKGRFGVGQAGRTAMDLRRRAAAQQALQNNQLLRQLGFDDNGVAVLALSGGTRAGAERAARVLQRENGWSDDQRERAIATASNVGFNNTNAAAAIEAMAQNKSRALTGRLAGEAGMDLVRQSATQLSGGNEQMTENLMGGFAYHSRNAGRLDLGGEFAGQTLQQGWNRAGVSQHAQSFGASLQAFADDFVPSISSGTPQQREAAATALLEMQNMLPYATAENQTIINEALTRAGVNHDATETRTLTRNMTDANGNLLRDATGNVVTESYDQVVPVAIEDQLARLAGGTISPTELRSQARVYDAQTPFGERGAGVPPPGAPTGAPGSP